MQPSHLRSSRLQYNKCLLLAYYHFKCIKYESPIKKMYWKARKIHKSVHKSALQPHTFKKKKKKRF